MALRINDSENARESIPAPVVHWPQPAPAAPAANSIPPQQNGRAPTSASNDPNPGETQGNVENGADGYQAGPPPITVNTAATAAVSPVVAKAQNDARAAEEQLRRKAELARVRAQMARGETPELLERERRLVALLGPDEGASAQANLDKANATIAAGNVVVYSEQAAADQRTAQASAGQASQAHQAFVGTAPQGISLNFGEVLTDEQVAGLTQEQRAAYDKYLQARNIAVRDQAKFVADVEEINKNLAILQQLQGKTGQTVTVGPNDTLSGIARRSGVSLDALIGDNPRFDRGKLDGVVTGDSSDPDLLLTGQQITVSAAAAGVSAVNEALAPLGLGMKAPPPGANPAELDKGVVQANQRANLAWAAWNAADAGVKAHAAMLEAGQAPSFAAVDRAQGKALPLVLDYNVKFRYYQLLQAEAAAGASPQGIENLQRLAAGNPEASVDLRAARLPHQAVAAAQAAFDAAYADFYAYNLDAEGERLLLSMKTPGAQDKPAMMARYLEIREEAPIAHQVAAGYQMESLRAGGVFQLGVARQTVDVQRANLQALIARGAAPAEIQAAREQLALAETQLADAKAFNIQVELSEAQMMLGDLLQKKGEISAQAMRNLEQDSPHLFKDGGFRDANHSDSGELDSISPTYVGKNGQLWVSFVYKNKTVEKQITFAPAERKNATAEEKQIDQAWHDLMELKAPLVKTDGYEYRNMLDYANHRVQALSNDLAGNELARKDREILQLQQTYEGAVAAHMAMGPYVPGKEPQQVKQAKADLDKARHDREALNTEIKWRDFLQTRPLSNFNLDWKQSELRKDFFEKFGEERQRVFNEDAGAYVDPLDPTQGLPDQIRRALGENHETTKVDPIVSKVKELGGDNPKVRAVPVYLAMDGGPLYNTALFVVTGKDGQEHIIDDKGREYKSLDQFREDHQLPSGGTLYLPENLSYAKDDSGNVAIRQMDIEGDPYRNADIAVGIITSIATIASFTPLAPVAVPVAIAGGSYMGARSGMRLWDMYQHGEDMTSKDAAMEAAMVATSVLPVGGGMLRTGKLLKSDVPLLSATKIGFHANRNGGRYGVFGQSSYSATAGNIFRKGGTVLRAANAADIGAMVVGIPLMGFSGYDVVTHWDEMSTVDQINGLLGVTTGFYGTGRGLHSYQQMWRAGQERKKHTGREPEPESQPLAAPVAGPRLRFPNGGPAERQAFQNVPHLDAAQYTPSGTSRTITFGNHEGRPYVADVRSTGLPSGSPAAGPTSIPRFGRAVRYADGNSGQTVMPNRADRRARRYSKKAGTRGHLGAGPTATTAAPPHNGGARLASTTGGTSTSARSDGAGPIEGHRTIAIRTGDEGPYVAGVGGARPLAASAISDPAAIPYFSDGAADANAAATTSGAVAGWPHYRRAAQTGQASSPAAAASGDNALYFREAAEPAGPIRQSGEAPAQAGEGQGGHAIPGTVPPGRQKLVQPADYAQTELAVTTAWNAIWKRFGRWLPRDAPRQPPQIRILNEAEFTKTLLDFDADADPSRVDAFARGPRGQRPTEIYIKRIRGNYADPLSQRVIYHELFHYLMHPAFTNIAKRFGIPGSRYRLHEGIAEYLAYRMTSAPGRVKDFGYQAQVVHAVDKGTTSTLRYINETLAAEQIHARMGNDLFYSVLFRPDTGAFRTPVIRKFKAAASKVLPLIPGRRVNPRVGEMHFRQGESPQPGNQPNLRTAPSNSIDNLQLGYRDGDFSALPDAYRVLKADGELIIDLPMETAANGAMRDALRAELERLGFKGFSFSLRSDGTGRVTVIKPQTQSIEPAMASAEPPVPTLNNAPAQLKLRNSALSPEGSRGEVIVRQVNPETGKLSFASVPARDLVFYDPTTRRLVGVKPEGERPALAFADGARVYLPQVKHTVGTNREYVYNARHGRFEALSAPEGAALYYHPDLNVTFMRVPEAGFVFFGKGDNTTGKGPFTESNSWTPSRADALTEPPANWHHPGPIRHETPVFDNRSASQPMRFDGAVLHFNAGDNATYYVDLATGQIVFLGKGDLRNPAFIREQQPSFAKKVWQRQDLRLGPAVRGRIPFFNDEWVAGPTGSSAGLSGRTKNAIKRFVKSMRPWEFKNMPLGPSFIGVSSQDFLQFRGSTLLSEIANYNKGDGAKSPFNLTIVNAEQIGIYEGDASNFSDAPASQYVVEVTVSFSVKKKLPTRLRDGEVDAFGARNVTVYEMPYGVPYSKVGRERKFSFPLWVRMKVLPALILNPKAFIHTIAGLRPGLEKRPEIAIDGVPRGTKLEELIVNQTNAALGQVELKVQLVTRNPKALLETLRQDHDFSKALPYVEADKTFAFIPAYIKSGMRQSSVPGDPAHVWSIDLVGQPRRVGDGEVNALDVVFNRRGSLDHWLQRVIFPGKQYIHETVGSKLSVGAKRRSQPQPHHTTGNSIYDTYARANTKPARRDTLSVAWSPSALLGKTLGVLNTVRRSLLGIPVAEARGAIKSAEEKGAASPAVKELAGIVVPLGGSDRFVLVPVWLDGILNARRGELIPWPAGGTKVLEGLLNRRKSPRDPERTAAIDKYTAETLPKLAKKEGRAPLRQDELKALRKILTNDAE